MNLYPAIDLYEGQVVRLTRGDYQQKTIYSEHPGKMAWEWESQGAEWLHIVDLEGARDGAFKNLEAVSQIRKAVSCQLQFGGGIRSFDQIQTMIDLGINRIVLGTKALEKDFFESALSRFQDSIAVGLDVKNGIVQTRGWLDAAGTDLKTALFHFNQYPLKTIIYTDIQKDGMLLGPNFDSLKEVLSLAKASVILSGGISCLQDIQECLQIQNKNFDGAIIGKALYDKKFTLREALHLS